MSHQQGRVLGLGGVFFKTADPAGLRAWYKQWLGLPMDEYGACLPVASLPADAYSVVSPFSDSTDYFAPSQQPFMINLVVDDVQACLARLAGSGAQILPETENGEFGHFGWFIDPAGNKIELWQPPVATGA
ncbi:VOC family protein [Simiduia agarivorans]|uniref:VOC domain-containing protein n=1 Tax=Simiduia agarivorans (strain DSM 21679 / JCM 13881 / BCRC 17597 / SA1) TaxID=1117647 RepID=K4KHP8_SIMAS|nr:VOC family protein [Simiduia agarivorans]AFU97493.1 hypothetical protein M5M_01320 [Simiduia agarivorans SA1 = DSM 21679]